MYPSPDTHSPMDG
jgi:hypothetical protein